MAPNMWQLMKITVLIVLLVNCGLAEVNVIKLNEDNWEKLLTNEWMVEFYAPWCPACNALQPVWDSFSSLSKELGISVGQVDVTASPGLSGRFMVTALPTIYHVLNGEFRQYRGAREEEAFVSFIRDKKWKSVDAIPGWKSPETVQMSVVSYFFKLSQVLRTVHNNLMEEYGLPTWGSYLIFAVATIFFGAILGLMLVCIIDVIYPPKPLPPRSTSAEDKERIIGQSGVFNHGIDELDDQDDLVDENTEGDDVEHKEGDDDDEEEDDDDDDDEDDDDDDDEDEDEKVYEEVKKEDWKKQEHKVKKEEKIERQVKIEKEEKIEKQEKVKKEEEDNKEDAVDEGEDEEQGEEGNNVRKRKPRKAD